MSWNCGLPGILINASKPENNDKIIKTIIILRFTWIVLSPVGCIYPSQKVTTISLKGEAIPSEWSGHPEKLSA
jgi:hypothetical protein